MVWQHIFMSLPSLQFINVSLMFRATKTCFTYGKIAPCHENEPEALGRMCPKVNKQ